MTSFYPGPSKMHPLLGEFLQKTYESGILSNNHRSKQFENLYQETSKNLKNWLSIPENYELLFFSSATECWQVLTQHPFGEERLHIFNGAFGQKWAEVSENLTNQKVEKIQFDIQNFPEINYKENIDFVALTQCETSNGTFLPNQIIAQIRDNYPKAVIAVDATSAMAGINTQWENADIWFASLQKCFGLPSGLAVMFIKSDLAKSISENKAKDSCYNSLSNSIINQQKWQTTHTPNILGIHLLNQLAQTKLPNFELLEKSMQNWIHFFEQNNHFQSLIKNSQTQSPTVIAATASEDAVSKIKYLTEKQELIIGNGYGEWKKNSIRIANFPVHTHEEKLQLMEILKHFQN